MATTLAQYGVRGPGRQRGRPGNWAAPFFSTAGGCDGCAREELATRVTGYGWQPQSEVFHTADYILEPLTQFTLCKYGGTTLPKLCAFHQRGDDGCASAATRRSADHWRAQRIGQNGRR